jgi:REP element-mobilizing transposase RayT
MPNYRRAFVPGGCWFFTVNLLERRNTLLVDRIDALRDAMGRTHEHHAFVIDAIVVLPDHIHAVWTLPPGDADFSLRWRLIKSRFAQALPKRERLSDVRKARGERGYLAAAILGTPYQGRGGLRPPCRILLHQPGETRVGGKGARLAALVVSSGYACRNFSGRWGGRRGSDRRVL